MPFVFSPSNYMTYKQCPRKFFGQSISRQIKYRPSKQKSRGIILHEQIQEACRNIKAFDKVRNDTEVDVAFAKEMVDSIWESKKTGALYIEHELCMDKAGRQVGWWDDKAFLRAKADIFLLPSRVDDAVRIVDVKTGKKWDDADDQLRLEALLAHIIYGRPLVSYEYWYVDQGEIVDGLIDFRNGLAPVQDLYDTIKEIGRAIKNNDFPAQENKFCRWCQWYKREECGL